jgi:hypothetical protein
MRETVGGTLLATDDYVSSLLGPDITGALSLGRWAGRRLIGADGRSIAVFSVYFPTFADHSHPGSAWQTQLAYMLTMPLEKRAKDPWHQALSDLEACLVAAIMHKSSNATENARIVLVGDFNARWLGSGASAQSRERTEALRRFAAKFGLSEVFSTIHPQIIPTTFVASQTPGARQTWIDFAFASTELLTEGHIREAGILLHETLNSSDHRAYMIEIDLAQALRIGPEWKIRPQTDPRLPKLNVKDDIQVGQFQLRVAKQWKRLGLTAVQQSAEDAVGLWRKGVASDAAALTHLEVFCDALIVLLVGAWRTVSGCLPMTQSTGGSRKNIWSTAYVAKAREYRTLVDITSMWQRWTPKEAILDRLTLCPALSAVAGATPTLNSNHVEWRDWIRFVATKARAKRGELHGVWRAKARTAMLGVIKSRSDGFAKGAQRGAISSWLNRIKRPPPMRSVTLETARGLTQIVEPTSLKRAADDTFEQRASGGYGPSRWYDDHILESPCSTGHSARLALAQMGTAGLDDDDLARVPAHIRPALDAAQYKYIEDLGGFATPKPYEDRGIMQPRTDSQWLAWWASKKKGTTPGQSQLSVNLIWALQLSVCFDQAVVKAAKNAGKPHKGKRECLTHHVFTALKVLTNLVLETALVPSSMLRNILVLIDKTQGCNAMTGKRPLGMVEQLSQATLGPQFRIIEDVWHDYRMIDPFQSGGTRGIGCEVPLMNLTSKMEHAYIYKQFLALILQDQSKAFETLHQYLGQDIPMRRLGIPEDFLRLMNAFKTGSWFMVATAWGPRQADWDLIHSRLDRGVNTMFALPPGPGDPPQRQVGFHDLHGTTQGGAGGPTTYRGYYDWWVSYLRMRLRPNDPAPYLGRGGVKKFSPGDGFIDDTGLTLTSIPAVVRALQASMEFYELQDGALNVVKTTATIADPVVGSSPFRLKRLALEGEVFNPKFHIPATIEVPNAAARAEAADLRAQIRESDACSESCTALRSRLLDAETRTNLIVKVLDPYDSVLYLGVWLSLSLFYTKAVAAAKDAADLAAAAILTTAIKPKEALELARMVPRAQAVYMLKCTTAAGAALDTIDSKLRAAVKTKAGHCRGFANLAFDGTQYESIAQSLLSEKVMMFLRLLRHGGQAADALQGSLWRYQRWLGTSVPALEYGHCVDMGWDGTWISLLAIELSQTTLKVVGGDGLRQLCANDVCLVDLATVEEKALVAQGCWKHEAWRVSEISDSTGRLRSELSELGEWAEDEDWCTVAARLYTEWLGMQVEGSGWKDGVTWFPDQIREHTHVARRGLNGDCDVGLVTDVHARGQSMDDTLKVTVRWFRRHSRRTAYPQAPTDLKLWLDHHGGKGPAAGLVLSVRDRSLRSGLRSGHDSRHLCWHRWLWDCELGPHNVVQIKDLIPVKVASKGITFPDGTKRDYFAVAESAEWPMTVKWASPTTCWQLDVTTLAGTRYAGTSEPPDSLLEKANAWDETMLEAECDSVLYGYSDCSKTRVGPRQVLSYGWTTGGLAHSPLIRGIGTAQWTVARSEDDFADLQPGLWGGGVVQGQQRELTTFRGEAYGVLSLMTGVRLTGFPGHLLILEDNKAVADKFCGRVPVVDEPQSASDASVPCLDDLADADLWAAIDAERARWGGRVKVQWIRSHPERRKIRQAWDRHEHGNSWSDLQADDVRVALTHTLDDDSNRLQLVDPAAPGSWALTWEGEMVVCSVNRTIRAALRADAFAKYLEQKRGWGPDVLSAFSRERWASKLGMLRSAANATLLTKMITGWLASQSVMLKRGQVDIDTLTEDQVLGLGVCRLCGTEPETNWHVHARCLHPDVVAERRAVSLRIGRVIEDLGLPIQASQVLHCNWLLDNEGRAHDLTDLQGLQELLRSWAPDIAERAEQIQTTLAWDATQGPHRDNLRKWSYRGLMLDHWTILLGELGVPRKASIAALHQVESEVLKSLPAVWGIFSSLTHDAEGRKDMAADLSRQIDAFFADWATDQEPIPITRAEVGSLTLRARRKWLAARRRQLKRRRATRVVGHSGPQPQITSCFSRVQVDGAVLEAAASLRYARAAGSRGRKRRRWIQQTLRDMGMDQGQVPLASATSPGKRRRKGGRAAPATSAPTRDPNRSSGPPRVPLVERFGTNRDRRRKARTQRSSQPVPEKTASETTGTGQATEPSPDTRCLTIRHPVDQEDTQHAIFERG